MPDVEIAQDVEADDSWAGAFTEAAAKLSAANDDAEPAPAAEAPQATPEAEAPTPEESAPAPEGRARDEKGRFVPKAAVGTPSPAEPKEAPGGVAPDPAPIGTTPPAPVVESLKAPQSWRAAEREAFGKAPREVQEAAIRREREVQGVLNDSAEARKLADAFHRTVAPYEALMRQSGATHPLQAVDRLLQTAYALNTGTIQQRAQTIAGIVQQYLGADEAAANALNAAWESLRSKPGTQSTTLDPQMLVQQAKQELARELAASRQQQAWRESAAEMEKFKANAEFLADVKEDMADILEMASRRGVELSLEDAYKKACTLHPEVSRVMQQREASKQAATPNGATQRAKAAASSVKSSPGAGLKHGSPDPDDWHSAYAAQFAEK